MKMVQCLLVDDEPLAITVLEHYLQRLEGVHYHSCDNAITALQRLQATAYDLVFLDIEMPVFSGLELIKTLKNPPAIIITSAFSNFALQGFDYEVLDYLVKPVSFPRFLKAFERFLRRQSQSHTQAALPGEQGTFLFLKTEKKYIRLQVSEILYVESMKDYIKVHTTTGSFLSYQTLSNFAGQLPAQQFMRIHRSYIIALEKVVVFTPEQVEIGKKQLPISRERRKVVVERLVSHRS